MKKTALILAVAALICTAFTACSGGGSSDSAPSSSTASSGGASTDQSSSAPESTATVSPSEKTNALKNAVEFPSMVEVTENNLDPYYGIDSADLTDFSAFICPTGVSPDEFGVFVAKDADAAARIEEALKKRVESQDKIFRDYPAAAEYVYKLDDCFVKVNENVVSYAICADNLKAKELLG